MVFCFEVPSTIPPPPERKNESGTKEGKGGEERGEGVKEEGGGRGVEPEGRQIGTTRGKR